MAGGGDVNDEWLNKWAKKLNPPAVFTKFKGRGDQPPAPIGTVTEFGTKKVYQTSRYATTADATRVVAASSPRRRRVVAASNYHLFLFDTTGGMEQLLSRQLPSRSDAEVVWDVATSGDGALTAVTLFGSGPARRNVCLLSGAKWQDVATGRGWRGPTVTARSACGTRPTGRRGRPFATVPTLWTSTRPGGRSS